MTEKIILTVHDDMVLNSAGIDFYLSSTHHVKFSGYEHDDPGYLYGSIWVRCGGYSKMINLWHTYGGNQSIPLYWDPANVPVWQVDYSYDEADKVQGDGEGLGHLYRCTGQHYSVDDTRPMSGKNWDLYWEQRDDLDDGRKLIFINDYGS